MPSATKDHGKDAGSLRGVYLITQPRSASNLFQKMLSNQEVIDSGYFFYAAGIRTFFDFSQGPLSVRSEAEREEAYQNYRAGYDKLQDFLGDAAQKVSLMLIPKYRKGQKVLIKEHAVFLAEPRELWSHHYDEDKVLPLLKLGGKDERHTNCTVCPDSLLESLQPIIQIRNPILMFPSMARASRKVGYKHEMSSDPSMSLWHSKQLYEWYLANVSAADPLVIDADDVMNDRGAVRKLCIEAGLDPEAVIYEWDTKQESDPYKQIFLSTIGASKGIVPGLDSKGLSLEQETKKWKEEFGEEDGEGLARRVKEAMPDYEYLHSRRIISD